MDALSSIINPTSIRVLSVALWLLSMGGLAFVAFRQIRLMRIRRLLWLKRLLLVISLSLLIAGILPLLARLFILQDQPLDPMFAAVSGLASTISYFLAAFALVVIYVKNPNTHDDEKTRPR